MPAPWLCGWVSAGDGRAAQEGTPGKSMGLVGGWVVDTQGVEVQTPAGSAPHWGCPSRWGPTVGAAQPPVALRAGAWPAQPPRLPDCVAPLHLLPTPVFLLPRSGPRMCPRATCPAP